MLQAGRTLWASLLGSKPDNAGAGATCTGESAQASEPVRQAREPKTVEGLEQRGQEWFRAMAGADGLERAKRYLEAFLCLIDAMFLAERTERAEHAARLKARIDVLREEFLGGFASPELGEMAELEARGEKAYDDMYEAHGVTAAGCCYNDIKDYFARAIGLAEGAGMTEEAQRLQARLNHIRAVYRSQFS
jgi:hypothetical protein